MDLMDSCTRNFLRSLTRSLRGQIDQQVMLELDLTKSLTLLYRPEPPKPKVPAIANQSEVLCFIHSPYSGEIW